MLIATLLNNKKIINFERNLKKKEGGEKRSFGETFNHGFRSTTTELQGSRAVIGSLTHGNGSPAAWCRKTLILEIGTTT